MTPEINAIVLLGSMFIFGAFAGAWLAEHQCRKEAAKNLDGRININMPARQEDTELMIQLLTELVSRAEEGRLDA